MPPAGSAARLRPSSPRRPAAASAPPPLSRRPRAKRTKPPPRPGRPAPAFSGDGVGPPPHAPPDASGLLAPLRRREADSEPLHEAQASPGPPTRPSSDPRLRRRAAHADIVSPAERGTSTLAARRSAATSSAICDTAARSGGWSMRSCFTAATRGRSAGPKHSDAEERRVWV